MGQQPIQMSSWIHDDWRRRDEAWDALEATHDANWAMRELMEIAGEEEEEEVEVEVEVEEEPEAEPIHPRIHGTEGAHRG